MIRLWLCVFLGCAVMALAGSPELRAQNAAATAAPQAAGQQPPTQAAPANVKSQQFLMKLIPPRPSFATDMTPHEQELMQQHAMYWAEQFKSGKVLIIGPVMDPRGAWGMAVLECANQAEAQELADNDPTVKAGLNKIEVAPMHVFLRKQ